MPGVPAPRSCARSGLWALYPVAYVTRWDFPSRNSTVSEDRLSPVPFTWWKSQLALFRHTIDRTPFDHITLLDGWVDIAFE
eukprot:6939046-Pyramimonas_sp.AAC.3